MPHRPCRGLLRGLLNLFWWIEYLRIRSQSSNFLLPGFRHIPVHIEDHLTSREDALGKTNAAPWSCATKELIVASDLPMASKDVTTRMDYQWFEHHQVYPRVGSTAVQCSSGETRAAAETAAVGCVDAEGHLAIVAVSKSSSFFAIRRARGANHRSRTIVHLMPAHELSQLALPPRAAQPQPVELLCVV